jgi:hypothetical protein
MGEPVIDLSRADVARSVRKRSHTRLAQATAPSVRKRSHTLAPAAAPSVRKRRHTRLAQATAPSVRKRSHTRLAQATHDSSRTPTRRYNGAGNGIRTRDPQLGRLALYR